MMERRRWDVANAVVSWRPETGMKDRDGMRREDNVSVSALLVGLNARVVPMLQ